MFSHSPVLLEAQNIEKKFGGVKALSDGNLKIYKGKICGLLGANGSGKSTISKIITGIHTPSKGNIIYKGEKIVLQNPIQAAEKNIAMVHQHLSLIPELTVWQNICLGVEQRSKGGFLDKSESYKSSAEMLRQFSASIKPESKVCNLSPAEKQIVEIVKSLYKKPEILILDEPTAALEQKEVSLLFDVIRSFKEDLGIIFISHRMQEVFEICDYVTIFRNGWSVGDINFSAEEKNEDKIISLMTGHDQKYSENRTDCPDKTIGSIQLEVKNLNIPKKLKHINLQIRKGEILGISGLQGQGQEELLLALSGYLRTKDSLFYFESQQKQIKHPKDALKNGIVLVPGDRNLEGLFMEHSIEENLIFPQFSVNMMKGILNKKAINNQSEKVMKKLSVAARDKKQKVSELSGGNQQKIVLGKWLAHTPSVLLLSDPAKGVDVPAKEELYKVVQELAETGTAVILYASDNHELIEICDRILVMFEGQIVQDLQNDCLSDEILVTHGLHLKECEDAI